MKNILQACDMFAIPVVLAVMFAFGIAYIGGKYLDNSKEHAPWIQVPESTTSFLPIDLSDGTKCIALKVDHQVAITCNWSTTPNQ